MISTRYRYLHSSSSVKSKSKKWRLCHCRFVASGWYNGPTCWSPSSDWLDSGTTEREREGGCREWRGVRGSDHAEQKLCTPGTNTELLCVYKYYFSHSVRRHRFFKIVLGLNWQSLASVQFRNQMIPRMCFCIETIKRRPWIIISWWGTTDLWAPPTIFNLQYI